MPGAIRAVPGTNTIYAMLQATKIDEQASNLINPRYSYRGDAKKVRPSSYTFPKGFWPARTGFSCDPSAAPNFIFQQCLGQYNGDYEPISCDSPGTASRKFIMGTCKDISSVPVSGAIVQGFRTVDDVYVGEITADSNGKYEFGTPHVGLQHYLVAYRAGSPDIAGTTVNTLVPTNRDGT